MRFTTQPQHKTDRRTAADVPVTFAAGHRPTVNASTPKSETAALARCGELARRAVSAAMLAMPDRKVYSDSDVADVAAEIVARVLADSPVKRCPCGGPVRWRQLVTDDYGTAVPVWRCDEHRSAVARMVIDRTDFIPAHKVAVTRLYGLASNLRRSLDRQRDRDAKAAGAEAAANRFSPAPEDDTAEELAGSPEAAHRAAMALLAAAGVRESAPVRNSDRTAAIRRREAARVALLRAVHGDRPEGSRGASVAAYVARVESAVWRCELAEELAEERRPRWTPLYPLRKGDGAVYVAAYAAVRSVDDVDRDELATELAISVETLKKSRQRGNTRLSFGTAPQWARKLSVPEGGTARPRCEGLPESNGVRTAPGHVFPNVENGELRTAPVHVRRDSRPPVKVWTAVAPERRRTAAWTATLPPRSHSRLAAAARITRERAALKDTARREADRPAMIPGAAPLRTGEWTAAPAVRPVAAPLVAIDRTARPDRGRRHGTPPLAPPPCAATRSALVASMLAAREAHELGRAAVSWR